MDTVQEIKSRLSIEEVVAPYVLLKKAGRNFKGLCPFHQEKTPSFFVSSEKQIAYCFSCNKGGDIFKFIEEIEGVDFRGAINILAEKAGVEVSFNKSDTFIKGKKDQKRILYDANEAAAGIFMDNLWSEKGRKALEYFQNRGLKNEIIKKFKLGLALDSFEDLYKRLLDKGFNKEQLVQAGLAIAKDINMEKVYDRFRDRLMFPIFNLHGDIAGFTGRVMDPQAQPKYLNTSDTIIYDKSAILYGLNFAKESIRKSDEAVIVEGNMDVIASHQAGIENVVASSGTALTFKQLNLLKRFSRNLSFCFDNDKAGRDAFDRAVELGQKHEFNLKAITLKNGKDPDECVKKDPNLWKESILEARDYMTLYFDNFQKQKFDNLVEKKTAISAIMAVIKRVTGKIEQDEYIKNFASILQTKPQFVYEEMRRLKSLPVVNEARSDNLSKNLKLSKEQYFIGLLCNFPAAIQKISEIFDEIYLSEELRLIYQKLLNSASALESFQLVEILEEFEDGIKEKINLIALQIDVQVEDSTEDWILSELFKVIDKLKIEYYDKMRRNLLFKMKEARVKGDREAERILFKQYSELQSSCK